jgi:hypothetical protein
MFQTFFTNLRPIYRMPTNPQIRRKKLPASGGIINWIPTLLEELPDARSGHA